MSTTDRIPEYLYTQDDINHIIQENKKFKEEIEKLRNERNQVLKDIKFVDNGTDDKINLESLN